MIAHSLLQRAREMESDLSLKYHENFSIHKKDVLDYAFQSFKIDSLAELGCVWGIDCAYSLYSQAKYHPSKITAVDTHWTDTALELCGQAGITVIQDDFGKPYIPERIGKVDAVIFFDILLHQVAPDWSRMLQMYTPYTESFLIVNPQFIASPISVRLLDLGQDEYFRNVPHDPNEPPYSLLFSKMYEMHPDHDKIWRDVHNVWQWGITDQDLIGTLEKLGFRLEFFKNLGPYGNLKNFEYHSFVFRKKP